MLWYKVSEQTFSVINPHYYTKSTFLGILENGTVACTILASHFPNENACCQSCQRNKACQLLITLNLYALSTKRMTATAPNLVYVRHLTTRSSSRKIWVQICPIASKFCRHLGSSRVSCQISERYIDINTQYCGFDASPDRGKRHTAKPLISCTLVGYKIVDHSDVVEASPIGAAQTLFSFAT